MRKYRHKPFSKRLDGQERRKERRARIAAKHMWLMS